MAKTRCSTECAQDFRRIEKEKTDLVLALANRSDFRWLIEAPGPLYLAVQRLSKSDNFVWTKDHNEAFAFRSQAQANDMMSALRQLDRQIESYQNNGKLSWGKLFAFEPSLGNAKAVEHGWLSPPLPREVGESDGGR